MWGSVGHAIGYSALASQSFVELLKWCLWNSMFSTVPWLFRQLILSDARAISLDLFDLVLKEKFVRPWLRMCGYVMLPAKTLPIYSTAQHLVFSSWNLQPRAWLGRWRSDTSASCVLWPRHSVNPLGRLIFPCNVFECVRATSRKMPSAITFSPGRVMRNVREIYDRWMFSPHVPWLVRECLNQRGWNQYGLRLRHCHVRLFRLKEASQRQPHHLRLQEHSKR